MQLIRFAGIPVKIHWTFGLIIIWVIYYSISAGLDIAATALALAVILALFLCVVLHEYGHALTARLFGVSTRDIILSPIGGLARLSHIPENPWQEIAVALAGPLVNLLIAVVIIGTAMIAGVSNADIGDPAFWTWSERQNVFILIAKVNLILMLFNLFPAFPMDGGRVFRALLCLVTTRLNATRIASAIGQLAGLFLVSVFLIEMIIDRPVQVGGVVLSGLITALIGGFVIIAARTEYQHTRTRERMKAIRIGELMETDFVVIPADETVSAVLEHVMPEMHYLVKDNSGIVGVVAGTTIHNQYQEGNLDSRVGGLVYGPAYSFEMSGSLTELIEAFVQHGLHLAAVESEGVLTGVISRRTLSQATSE